ncbi:MAG: NUDIX hydrolase [Acidimicrobiia bacterium]|nr:NUDIX hydrolase [Acidimicrobiia bacterium]
MIDPEAVLADSQNSLEAATEPRPEGYDPGAFAPFAVTVDIVLLTWVEHQLSVLLIRRGKPPYEGAWALPGGFVEPDEDLAEAAVRELLEETGIGVEPGSLLQVGAYGHPARDPRMRVVTVAYGLIVAQLAQSPRGGSDAARAELVSVAEVQRDRVRLAFDHRLIVVAEHDAGDARAAD